ncbi:MAG: biotin/lipoyl-binding protein, partial [Prochloraceae cyanobacterium]
MKTVKEKLKTLLEQDPNLFDEISIDELAKVLDLVHQGNSQIAPRYGKAENNGSQKKESSSLNETKKSDFPVKMAQETVNNGKKPVNSPQDNLTFAQQYDSEASNLVANGSTAIAKVNRQLTQETLVPIEPNELLPSVSIWTILGGLITASAIAIAVIMATVIQYKVVVKGNAVVRPAGELRLVQASTEGAVSGIFTTINQPVNKGDLIATLDSSQLQNQKIQMQTNIQQAQLQLTLIEAQINALESQIQAETDKIERAVAAAQAELERHQREYQDRLVTTVADVEEAEANFRQTEEELQEARAQLKSAQANLKSITAALNAARSKRNRYQPIAGLGALSQDQLEEAQLNVQQQEQVAASQRATIEAQQQIIERLQQAVIGAAARLKRVQTALDPSNAAVEMALENIAHQQATGKATLATLNKERQALI